MSLRKNKKQKDNNKKSPLLSPTNNTQSPRFLLLIRAANFRRFLRDLITSNVTQRVLRRVGCRCTRIILRSRSRHVVFSTAERRSTHSSVVSDDETHARPPVVCDSFLSLDSMAVNDANGLNCYHARLFPSAFVFIRMSFVV